MVDKIWYNMEELIGGSEERGINRNILECKGAFRWWFRRSEVGKIFLPSGLLTFFIVGGPLFGVLTSMVPVIMLTCAQIQAAADNDLFPAFVGKKNKNVT